LKDDGGVAIHSDEFAILFYQRTSKMCVSKAQLINTEQGTDLAMRYFWLYVQR